MKAIKIWDNLSSNEKMSFGERFITHESNLKVWDKLFNDLLNLFKLIFDSLNSSMLILGYV